MQQMKLNFAALHPADLTKLAMLAMLLAAFSPMRSSAQQPGQKTFLSAQAACSALVAAAKDNDEKAMLEILGPDAKQIVTSGDDVEDAENRATFVKRYVQMHRLVKEPDGTTTLYNGAENWPLPIPLMNKGNAWYFDSAAGKKEILYRRVGRNEMSAIHVCQALVAAQKEYYSAHSSEYTQKIFSDEGQQNGLYWKADAGQPESPIGPLVASAMAEGYTPTNGDASATPYRGYHFRILTRQGANAPGGPKGYIVGGKLTGGFAFVAYPAEYRSSGVMTFIVGADGSVYRKDLGSHTVTIAKAMISFDPDATWKKEVIQQGEPSGERTTD
jgi:Protein of unknown function (DUF2950)